MKSRLFVGCLFAALLVSSSAAFAKKSAKEAAGKSSASAAAELKMRMENSLKAWETLDPANAAPFYAKEADHLFFDIAPLKYNGWAEYAEGVKKVIGNWASLKFTLGDDAQVHPQGNLAWTAATLRADISTKDGSHESLDGRWTVVWEKRGNDWLIVHEHVSAPLPAPADTSGQPLYKRLGGYDAIAAVVDDFIGRMVKDPQLAKFFVGHSTDTLHRIRQLVVDQLCQATGGPCIYIGRDMKSSHAGLGITENDWQVAVNHLVGTLDQFKVPAKEKEEVLNALSGLKKDIVERAGP